MYSTYVDELTRQCTVKDMSVPRSRLSISQPHPLLCAGINRQVVPPFVRRGERSHLIDERLSLCTGELQRRAGFAHDQGGCQLDALAIKWLFRDQTQ